LADADRSAQIRVGVCGLGSVGKKVAQLLLDHRTGVEIVGAATLEESDIGRPLDVVVGADAKGPVVVGSLEALLEARPEVIVYCTGSFLADVEEDVVTCARAGVSLVSPCEELAFPFTRFAEAAARIDTAARAGGATVLGSGVNPGFTFDSLLVALTGVCWDVRSIRGRRVVDTTGFGENIHRRLGIGFTLEEFDAGHRDGSIAGHVWSRSSSHSSLRLPLRRATVTFPLARPRDSSKERSDALAARLASRSSSFYT
jgi:hypothetical protein